MKNLRNNALIVFLAIISSCNTFGNDFSIEAKPGSNPWTHLILNNDPLDFQFLIVADRTSGMIPGVFAEAVDKINLLQPEFVISVGDLIYADRQDEKGVEHEWQDFDDIIEKLEMPFFYVPGNHDLAGKGMAKWQERFGRNYYHFSYRNVLFLCLDSQNFRRGKTNDEQIEYFQNVLGENPDVRWTLLFMHHPLWCDHDRDGSWAEIEKLLENRNYTVFNGHEHNYLKAMRNGHKYIQLGTTGGIRAIEGPGGFHHLLWVTMSDQGPRLANLMLNGITDENIVTKNTSPEMIQKGRELEKEIKSLGIPRTAIVCDSLSVEQDTFTGGNSRVWIINFADVPMKVKCHFMNHSFLRPTPNSFDLVLPAKSYELFECIIRVDQVVKTKEIKPLKGEFTISYESPTKYPHIELKVIRSIVIQKMTKK